MDEKWKKALRMMGYRELPDKKKWAKPVGHMVFVFEIGPDGPQIQNFFVGHNSEDLVCWSREVYKSHDESGNRLEFIAEYEKYNTNSNGRKPLGFLLTEEIFADIL